MASGALALVGTGSINNSVSINVTNGAIFDVSAETGFTMATNQNLTGFWQYKRGAGGKTSQLDDYPGTDGTVGTLTFSSGLPLGAGSTANFDLSTSASGGNDSIVVNGPLLLNGNVLHVKASGNLDQVSGDYVLIAANSIAGSFSSTPVFDVVPGNASFYTVQKSGNNVVLHYSTSHPATGVGATVPSSGIVRNQTIQIECHGHARQCETSTIKSVVVDATPLGGTVVNSRILSGGNVYTGNFVVPASTLPGPVTLTAAITDGNNLTGTGGHSVYGAAIHGNVGRRGRERQCGGWPELGQNAGS